MKKPSAADRTVDMFTGSTNVEAATQEDLTPEEKAGSPAIEANRDRYRDTAFHYQEHLSKNWKSDASDGEAFRLTINGPDFFLEKCAIKGGASYHWSGVMFKTESLEELARLFVDAVKARRANGQKG